MVQDRYSRVLVTGFGPFRDVTDNPSSKLATTSGAPFQVLDVAYSKVDEFLSGLKPEGFDVLLMLGVARGRDLLCCELFGRNFIGKHPDITGDVRFGQIDTAGELLLESTLWDAEVLAEWTTRLPVRASLDAGNFLCNYVSYRALEKLPSKRVGFLHVPPEDKLDIDRQAEVLRVVLDKLVGS